MLFIQPDFTAQSASSFACLRTVFFIHSLHFPSLTCDQIYRKASVWAAVSGRAALVGLAGPWWRPGGATCLAYYGRRKEQLLGRGRGGAGAEAS